MFGSDRSGGHVWPVGSIATYIRERLEADPVLGDVWISGEVSNVFRARSGHVYFTIKDDDGQLKVILFRQDALRQRYRPNNGDAIVAHGRVSVFPRDGSLQLYADLVEPAGQGLQQLQLELLRRQLEAEGLFAVERKRPLPAFPKVIGVVTSPDGAVWHDIQNVLRRRYPLVELVLAPAKVQGDDAPPAIVEAIQAIQRHPGVEVVIVARGGGSAEDLSAFNDERVARAVYASRVPVVSGVGHETDWTIVDDVADLRAPTPSAAAEVSTPSRGDLAVLVTNALDDLGLQMEQRLAQEEAGIRGAKQLLRQLGPRRLIQEHQATLGHTRLHLERSCTSALDRQRQRVQQQAAVLKAVDPHKVLGRGYAHLLHGTTGAVITNERDVTVGDQVLASVAEGAIRLVVEGQSHKTRQRAPRRAKEPEEAVLTPTLFDMR